MMMIQPKVVYCLLVLLWYNYAINLNVYIHIIFISLNFDVTEHVIANKCMEEGA